MPKTILFFVSTFERFLLFLPYDECEFREFYRKYHWEDHWKQDLCLSMANNISTKNKSNSESKLKIFLYCHKIFQCFDIRFLCFVHLFRNCFAFRLNHWFTLQTTIDVFFYFMFTIVVRQWISPMIWICFIRKNVLGVAKCLTSLNSITS